MNRTPRRLLLGMFSGFVLAPVGNLRSEDVPVTFTVSGGEVAARIAEADSPAVLTAFGRVWAGPSKPENGEVRFALPALRTPVVFAVQADDAEHSVLGRVVAYPRDHRVEWDEEASLLVAADCPVWFREWVAANGLPAEVVESAQRDRALLAFDRRGVLVVGAASAGTSAAELSRRIGRWKTHVLILEADWYPESIRAEGHVPVEPWQLRHGLECLSTQTWAQPLPLQAVAGPWRGIVNRWVWIDGPEAPLVEEVASGGRHRVVLSYLPWQVHLGTETGDRLFLDLLRAAAGPAKEGPPLDRSLDLVAAERGTVDRETHPVLHEALRRRPPFDSASSPLRVVDLRGGDLSAPEARHLRLSPPSAEAPAQVVLGTDPAWERLIADDPGKPRGTGRRAWGDAVQWIAADELPPSAASQVRLMQALTEAGVPLGTLNDLKPGE